MVKYEVSVIATCDVCKSTQTIRGVETDQLQPLFAKLLRNEFGMRGWKVVKNPKALRYALRKATDADPLLCPTCVKWEETHDEA